MLSDDDSPNAMTGNEDVALIDLADVLVGLPRSIWPTSLLGCLDRSSRRPRWVASIDLADVLVGVFAESPKLFPDNICALTYLTFYVHPGEKVVKWGFAGVRNFYKGAALIRAIIFDFDGLILDTESTVFQSWRELYRQYNRDLALEEWGQIIGTSANEHFDPLARLAASLDYEIDRAAVGEKRLRRELELVVKLPLLPGVTAYLERARKLGLKLAVASSSDLEWVGWHLERLNLRHYFDVVHTSDDVTRTKPDPALFQLALTSLGLDADQAIVLEDSSNGVTAAKQAGIFCVAVPNELTRHLPLDHADLLLNSLADLPLERLLARAVARKR